MEKQSFKKRYFILLLFFLIGNFASMSENISFVQAQTYEQDNMKEIDAEVINTYRDSIVRVESICWNGEDVVYEKKAFSGFVISKDTSGVYVVTVHNNLTYSAAEREAIEEENKTESNVRVLEKLEVVFKGDIRVKASILGESEQRNLTVLKLEQSINFDNILQFPNQNTVYKNNIYLLGYSAVEENKEPVYNSENVRITEGTKLDEFEKDDISFFTHNIEGDEGCIGGPLLYEDGTIAGVFLSVNEKRQGSALDSESVKYFLNAFQVPYEEKKTVEQEKIPILNIVLGDLIVLLIILLFAYNWKGKEKKNKEKKNKENKEEKLKKTFPSEYAVSASIEYPAEKRIVLIRKKRFVIGRTNEADFILAENKGISRQHACIISKNGEFYLSDLGSTNHTFLNGSELMEGEMRLLRNNDKIMVGKELLIFYRASAE